MLVARSDRRRPRPADPRVRSLVEAVSVERLKAYVDVLSFPRNYFAERPSNRKARDLLVRILSGMGCRAELQGQYDNVVATIGDSRDRPHLLLGAHYDSVAGTPGADDNASAMAVCLECARLFQEHDLGPTMVVFFNLEEDGLLGSRDFVDGLMAPSDWKIAEAHIFEMVGFRTTAPNSQRMPPGLPGLVAPKVGDFLALLANRNSNGIAEELLQLAATYVPVPPVLALKIRFGIEKYFGHLLRSDHAPFWEAQIPAVMWTDTSEFRNPNYHKASDAPATLDYDFLADVGRLAVSRAASLNR